MIQFFCYPSFLHSSLSLSSWSGLLHCSRLVYSFVLASDGRTADPSNMPKDRKKTHDENRFKCCALCYNESGHKATVPILPRVADIIREKCDQSYALDDSRYVTAVHILQMIVTPRSLPPRIWLKWHR